MNSFPRYRWNRSSSLAAVAILALLALTAGCGTVATPSSSSIAASPIATPVIRTPAAAAAPPNTPRPSASARPAPTLEPIVGIEVGQRAPALSLTTTDGAAVSLADLRGRPVWINFWSTTCPACFYEMPIMEARYREHQASGLEIVGVAVGIGEADAVAFADALGITFPLAVDTPGIGQGSAVDYSVFVLPAHYFIDRDGIVRGFVMGEAPPDSFDERLARIVGPSD